MATDLHTAANRLLKAWDLNDLIHENIEALRQALANEALDKMAENARELGLDYEPRRWAVFCQGCRKEWTVSYPHPGKSICADCDDKLAEQPAQQAIHCKHRRENNGVCPHHNLHCGWPKCNEPEQPAQQEPVNKYCCHLCFNNSGQVFLDRMILCPECGNKRCPKATHHGLPCTKSNDLGQKGSIYDQPAQRTWVGLTDEERKDIELGIEVFGTSVEDILKEAEAKLRSKNEDRN